MDAAVSLLSDAVPASTAMAVTADPAVGVAAVVEVMGEREGEGCRDVSSAPHCRPWPLGSRVDPQLYAKNRCAAH